VPNLLNNILMDEGVRAYLGTTPFGMDDIPLCGPWPWFVVDKNPQTRVCTAIPDTSGEDKWFVFNKPRRLNPSYMWFDGSGGIQWVVDETARIIKVLSDVLPTDAITVEKKYLKKFQPRDVTIDAVLIKEFVTMGRWDGNRVIRDYGIGKKADWIPSCTEDEFYTVVYNETVKLLQRLGVAPYKSEAEYLSEVKSCTPNNPQGSVALAWDGHRRLEGTKSDNWFQLVQLAGDLEERMRESCKNRPREIPYDLGIAYVPRTRKDGGPRKPRLLFMGPGHLYPLEKPILDRLSEAFKQSFDEFGYFPYSAGTYICIPGWKISSDYHRFDQSIPGVVIDAIVDAIGDVLKLPLHVTTCLASILRYAPIVWTVDDELFCIDKDGINPSGDGMFVAVNHIWAHVSQVVAGQLAAIHEGIDVAVISPPLKFGDDVIININTSKVLVDRLVKSMGEVFEYWNIGWKTDSISKSYGLYLRNHYFARNSYWDTIPVLSSRIRNLCCPERTEPTLWYNYLRGADDLPSNEACVNTALSMRIQLYGIAGIAKRFQGLSSLHPSWGKAAKMLDKLMAKLVARALPYLLEEVRDEALLVTADAELVKKYNSLDTALLD